MNPKVLFLLILSTTVACQTSSIGGGGAELPDGSVRATLPASVSGIEYANLDVPEMLPTGPSGIFSVKGGYVITDNVRGTIVVLNTDFDVTRTIDVRSDAQGILSVVSDGDDLVALDGYAQTPKLLRIDPSGKIKADEIRLDSPTGPTGLMRDDTGIILEYGGGETLYRIEENGTSIELRSTEGYMWGGVTFSVRKPAELYSHDRTVRIGTNVGLVRVPNDLGSLQIIGPDQNGGAFVLVEDVTFNTVISVEQTVWHFSASGEALSVAKVPLLERLLYVEHGVALDAGYKPVALVPELDELQFWNLVATEAAAIIDRKPNRLFDDDQSGMTASQALITYSGTCLSSAQMQSNANEYLNVSQAMTSNNINNNGSCTSRAKANYLGSPGTYSSVSYDWGGWDTPTAFKSAMNSGGKAGNLNTTTPLSCSYGADCSGFVTRVWGFTDWKRSTNDIPNSNTSKGLAYGPGYYMGDVFNMVGVHVVIYASTAANGYYIWESAGEPYGRVVYRLAPWSYVSGYTSWRSLTSCN